MAYANHRIATRVIFGRRHSIASVVFQKFAGSLDDTRAMTRDVNS